MAHGDAQQDPLPQREAALAHLLHGRVRPPDCRYRRRHSGQRLVYRRLREYEELYQREVTQVVDTLERADDVLGVFRQDGCHQRL